MMEEQKRYVSRPTDSPGRLVYDDAHDGLPLLYLVLPLWPQQNLVASSPLL